MENMPKSEQRLPECIIEELDIGGEKVTPSKLIKYLGVIIDDRLAFRDHIDYIAGKVNKVIAKLKVIFRNTYGYGNGAWKIMVKGAIYTLFIYPSSAYFCSISQYRSAERKIRQAQRKLNTLCGRAYKDISYIESTVMAGLPPLHFMIEK